MVGLNLNRFLTRNDLNILYAGSNLDTSNDYESVNRFSMIPLKFALQYQFELENDSFQWKCSGTSEIVIVDRPTDTGKKLKRCKKDSSSR